MFKQIKEFLLNTPEKYWLVIFGYHLHKSFWGVLFVLIGIGIINFYSFFYGTITLVKGLILITISISGHIYTNNKPYFKLWDKYQK